MVGWMVWMVVNRNTGERRQIHVFIANIAKTLTWLTAMVRIQTLLRSSNLGPCDLRKKDEIDPCLIVVHCQSICQSTSRRRLIDQG